MQFLLLEVRAGGPYVLLLPLIDNDRFRAQLLPMRAGRQGPIQLGVRVESGTDATQADRWSNVLLAAAGADPYELVDRAVVAAGRLSGGATPRWDKEMPEALDYFGWCTWDAFYTRVSPRGIAQGLSSLNKGGCKPRWLIIDDGWQTSQCDPEHGTGRNGATFLTAAHSRAASQHFQAQSGVSPFASGGLVSSSGGSWLTRRLSEPQELGPPGERGLLRQASSSRRAERALLQQSMGIVAASDLRGQSRLMAELDEVEEEGEEEEEEQAGQAELQEGEGGLPASPRLPERTRLWEIIYDFLYDIAASLFSWFAATFLLVIKLWLQGASYSSWHVRLFGRLARGPLRPAFLRFYASASQHTQRLSGIGANSKFVHMRSGPDTPRWRKADLAAVVRDIKQQFGVQYVLCWHALAGYWAGVAPTASMEKYHPKVYYARANPTLLEVDPMFAWNQFVLAGSGIVEDPYLLHSDMHAYLQKCGVDGVKVDVQSQIGLVGSALQGGPLLSGAYHRSLERSVAQHFPGNHCINCMCHCTEDLYRMEHTAVARCSDDFYPRLPESWLPHISICAFNTLFLGALVQGDWDMWQSKHPAAALHAAARVISGGPMYVSDRPRRHDFDLLRRLVLPDGSVLRAQLPGRPTRDCLMCDPNRDNRTALKIWNMNDVTGIVGVFNLQGCAYDRWKRRFVRHLEHPPTLTASVSPCDVEAFRPGSMLSAVIGPAGGARKYAVYAESSKRMQLLEPTEQLALVVAGGGWDLVAISPLRVGFGVGVAPIGLVNMLNCGGAVKSLQLLSTSSRPSTADGDGGALAGDGWQAAGSTCTGEDGREGEAAESEASLLGKMSAVADVMAVMLIKGCGTFLMYCSRRPQTVLLDEKDVPFDYSPATGKLLFEVPQRDVLLNEARVLI
ncbi:hypothetical protein N2152v2_005430 [Parachlorella kessleri]